MSYRTAKSAGGGPSSLGYMFGGDAGAAAPGSPPEAMASAHSARSPVAIDNESTDFIHELKIMSLPELRSTCRVNNITPAGSKGTLVDRLTQAALRGEKLIKAGPLSPPPPVPEAHLTAAGSPVVSRATMKQIISPDGSSPPRPAVRTPGAPAGATAGATYVPGETLPEDAKAAGFRGQYVPQGQAPFAAENQSGLGVVQVKTEQHRVIAPFGTALAPGEEPIPPPMWDDSAWAEPGGVARMENASPMRAPDVDEGSGKPRGKGLGLRPKVLLYSLVGGAVGALIWNKRESTKKIR